MAWFDSVKSLFGTETDAANLAPVTVEQPAAAAPAGAPVEQAPYDWVGAADIVLTQALRRLPVKPFQDERAVAFPVESVNLTASSEESRGLIMGSGNNSVKLTIKTKDKVGNYDIDSINRAIHAMLGNVPVLAGKVKFPKGNAAQALDHGDIWKELEPHLAKSGKFNKQELGLLWEYFEESKMQSAESADWGGIETQHADGKVQVRLRGRSIKGDEEVAVSGEARLVEHFTKHKEKILHLFREKIGALKVLTPEELAAIDYTAAITKADWGDQPTIEFGTKEKEGEPLGKTALAKIDTDKIQECFIGAFLEAEKELPSVFGRIGTAAMVAQVVKHRLGDTPEVAKLLDHEMFKSDKERNEEVKKEVDEHLVEIGNVVEQDKSNTLTLQFELPHGYSLPTLRESIVRGQQQLAVGSVRELTASGVGLAA